MGMMRPGGPMRPEMMQVEMLRNYLELVDRYVRLARDPAGAGVAAVVGANEILKPKGADAAIAYFTKVLPQVKNEAVQRAIRVQLAELYKTSGQADKALEQYEALMTSAPVGTGEPTPAPAPPPGR